jgi:lysozyme family protein
MTQDLDEALDYLLDEEGGWSNHKSDRGGATMYGVTQGTYDGWRKKKKRPQQSVRNISKDEARELYKSEYWDASSCDRLPWPVSYLVFDAAVNSGPSRAVTWCQTGLGVKPDGKVGPNTLAVAQRVVDEGIGSALLAIVDARVVFLSRLVQRDQSQTAFLLGWWRRTLRVLSRALLSEPEN